MKKNYYLIGIMLVLSWIVMDVSAQVREVPVAPGVGTLNNAIKGDTTETGDRIDPDNTVYVLERGTTAYYLLEGTISNSGYPLTIKAADGDGARPFLQPAVPTGGESARAFRPKADLTLMGLHVTNYDDAGGQPTRIIRASEDNIKIVVDDCWFDRDGQSFIRVDNPGMNIQITNCVVSNIGYPSSPDNGRGIDDRGNDIDTIIIENCTFYNISSRIIRDGGGSIGYCRVNNNTFMNIGQHGITFGPTGTLEVHNNIFVNAGFMPGDAMDPNYVLSVDSVGDVAPVVSFNRNIVYLDTTNVAAWFNDTIAMPVHMNETFKMAVMEAGGMPVFYTEPLMFTDAPPFNDSIIAYDLIPELNQDNAPFWEVPEIPAGGNDIYHLDVPYDFGYANALAYNLNGEEVPGGDSRWMAESAPFVGVDFEDSWETYLWGQFANSGDAPENMMVVANPDMSGNNDSEGVLMFNVLDGADPWAGAWSPHYGIMEFTQEKHHMTMMVHKDVISNAALKVEGGFDGAENIEVKVPNTVTGEWELITFDFSAAIGKTYRKLVFFPDFPDARESGSMCYLDQIRIITSPVGVEKKEVESLMVYPNPTTGVLNIQTRGIEQITIMDVLGKTVKAVQYQGLDFATLSVDELSAGIYFVTVKSESGSKTSKFLKK